MDDRQFDIQVTGVTREEYLQASGELIRSMIPTGLVLVTAVTMFLLVFTEEITLKAVLAPYVVLLLAIAGGYLYLRLSWKKFPQDVAYSFLIDAEGWQLTVGEDYGGADWDATAKLKEKSGVLLFYMRGSTASSSLPKRCLTEEQLEAIRGWYQASRADYKSKEKERARQDRQEQKAKRASRGSWLTRNSRRR